MRNVTVTSNGSLKKSNNSASSSGLSSTKRGPIRTPKTGGSSSSTGGGSSSTGSPRMRERTYSPGPVMRDSADDHRSNNSDPEMREWDIVPESNDNNLSGGTNSIPSASIDNAANSRRRRSAIDSMPDPVDVNFDESMTSASRLNDMLQSDSPLMQRARTQGRQTANNRGLLNSSMAAGAAQGAMIDRAQPFATTDSGNLFQNARQNANAQNQLGLLQSGTLSDSFLQGQQFRQQGALNEQGYNIDSNLAQLANRLGIRRDNNTASNEESLAAVRNRLGIARDDNTASNEATLANIRNRLGIARDDNTATNEGLLAEIRTGLGITRDDNTAGNEASLAEIRGALDIERDDNAAGNEASLAEIRGALGIERDDNTFENGLVSTAQEYGLRADELEQQGDQAMRELYGTSLANAWGRTGDNVTEIIAQSMSDLMDVQLNPNISPEDKTTLNDQIMNARNEDIGALMDTYDSLPDTLQGTGVFPDMADDDSDTADEESDTNNTPDEDPDTNNTPDEEPNDNTPSDEGPSDYDPSLFDDGFYLEQKLQQLQRVGEVNPETGEPYQSVDEVADVITGAGLTLEEHFREYGMEEEIAPYQGFTY